MKKKILAVLMVLFPLCLFAFDVPTVEQLRQEYAALMGPGVYKIQKRYNDISLDFSSVESNFLNLDGSLPMSGNLNMNGYDIVNVGNTSIIFEDGSKIVSSKFDSSGNIDAETFSSLTTTDFMLLDGSQVMSGNLDMGGYSISNVNNTSITFVDGSMIESSKFDSSGNIEAETLGSKNINTIETEYQADSDLLKNSRIFRVDINGKTAAQGADGIKTAFSNISEAMTAIEADIQTRIAGSETRSDCKYIVKINPGVYTESFSVPACSFLQFELAGAILSGDITRVVTQVGFGAEYYSKVVFVGGNSTRGEKGHQSVLSGDITFTTSEGTSYLYYTTFSGVELSGDMTISNGINVLKLDQAALYTSGKTILGTGSVLLEISNRSRVKATLSGDVACYDCRDSELNSVNVTPTSESTFYNMEFSGSFTFNSTTLNMDANSYKSLMSQSPTLNTVTIGYLEAASGIANDSSISGTSIKDAMNSLIKSYGELYENNDSGSAIAIGTAGNFYQWTSTTVGLTRGSGFVVGSDSTDNLTIGSSGAGIYEISLTSSFAGSIGVTYQCAVFKGGAIQNNIKFSRKIGTGSDVGDASAHGLLSLVSTDVLDVRCTSDASSDTLYVRQMNLTITR